MLKLSPALQPFRSPPPGKPRFPWKPCFFLAKMLSWCYFYFTLVCLLQFIAKNYVKKKSGGFPENVSL